MFGSWTLTRRIGKGGNSNVWEARDSNDVVGAIKFPFVSGNRYERFKHEVQIQTDLSGRDGVLPVLDSHVPDIINKKAFPGEMVALNLVYFNMLFKIKHAGYAR